MKSFLKAFLGGWLISYLLRLAAAPTVGGDTNVWGTGLLNWLGQAIDTATGQLLDAATSRQTINALTGTAYTLVRSDQGKLLNATNVGGITVTVPLDANMTGGAMDAASTTVFRQGAALQVAIVAAAGVTINSRGGLTHTAGQFSHIALVKIAANTYDLIGDLA